MSTFFQEWSLKDVLSILFGECEAEFIAQSMCDTNSYCIPESVSKNKDVKYRVIDWYKHLAESYYSTSTLGDEYFSPTLLGVTLNPLVVTSWLRDEKIFDNLFFWDPLPEGTEKKITGLKESTAKDFRSIDLEEFSKAEYWSEAEFYILLFSEAYSDIYFPEWFHKFPSSLDHEISQIKKYLVGAIEKGKLQAHVSAVEPILGERYRLDDDDRRYDPVQILRVLKSKQYPVPDKLIEHIEVGKYDQAAKQLKELRSKMLILLKKKGASPNNKENELEQFIRKLRVWCINDIEVIFQEPGRKPYVANTDNLGFQSVKTKEWTTLIAVLNSDNPVFYYGKSMESTKQLFLEIERKLLQGFEKIFKVNFPPSFKLIEPTKSKSKEKKFKFRVTPNPERVDTDYSGYDKDRILKVIKELAYANATPEDYAIAAKRAKELGIGDADIDKAIGNSKAIRDETDYGSVVDPYENQPNEGESNQY